MTTTGHFNFTRLRKEQRRVAALLQVQVDPPPLPTTKRQNLAANQSWRDRLISNGRKVPGDGDSRRESEKGFASLDKLRKGFRYVKERNDALFNSKLRRIPSSVTSEYDEILHHPGSSDLRRSPSDVTSESGEKIRHPEDTATKMQTSQPLKLPRIRATQNIARKHPGKGSVGSKASGSPVKLGHPITNRQSLPEIGTSKRSHGEYEDFSCSGGLLDAFQSSGKENGGLHKLPPVGPVYFPDARRAESFHSTAMISDQEIENGPFFRYSHGKNPVGEDFIRENLDDSNLPGNRSKKASSVSSRAGNAGRVGSFCACADQKDRVPQRKAIIVKDKCLQRNYSDGEVQNCPDCGKPKMRDVSDLSIRNGSAQPWTRNNTSSAGSMNYSNSRSNSKILSNNLGSFSNDEEGQMTYIDDLERKIKEGEFDYEVNVKMVGDIDQKIRIDSSSHEGLKNDSKGRIQSKPRPKIDIYRQAYIKALAVARCRTLPKEAWMLGNRISKPFVYSYYHKIPHQGIRYSSDEERIDAAKRYAPPKIIWKRGAEMKMIFGNVNPDDYIPGGPKNPYHYPFHLPHMKIPRSLPKMERRVQQAKPANFSRRKEIGLPNKQYISS